MKNNLPREDQVFPPYRVILCKYNEIGLKSATFQTKILDILIDSVKKICDREQLKLQSILNLPGRLLCFFPPEEIPAALQVFRFLIGVQSFAPAMTSPRKLRKLTYHCFEYISTLLEYDLENQISSMGISLRSVVSDDPETQRRETELRKTVKSLCIENHLPIHIEQHHPDQFLQIEMREKGTYLYHQEYPTYFAGFPIESKKVFLLPWTNTPEAFLAAIMLTRRGGIVIPFIMDPRFGSVPWMTRPQNHSNNSNNNKGSSFQDMPLQQDFLERLAQFYADPLPILSLKPSSPLFERLPRNTNNFPQLIELLTQFCEATIRKTIFKMGERNLHFKGIIYPMIREDLALESIQGLLPSLQKRAIISIFPLSGFDKRDVESIISAYLTHPSQFSFQSHLLDHLTENLPQNRLSDEIETHFAPSFSQNSALSLQESNASSRNPEHRDLPSFETHIYDQFQVDYIKGQIRRGLEKTRFQE